MSFIEWKDLFGDTFEGYPHQWTLDQVHRNNRSQQQKLQTWRTMERRGYARYHCPKCSRGWASAKSTVVFYYPRWGQALGQVTMRLFGQLCKQCSRAGNYYVDPEYGSDDMKLILEKLYERIGCDCYGKPRPPKPETSTRKDNNIQGPHEEKLCEACRAGCCDQVVKKNKP